MTRPAPRRPNIGFDPCGGGPKYQPDVPAVWRAAGRKSSVRPLRRHLLMVVVFQNAPNSARISRRVADRSSPVAIAAYDFAMPQLPDAAQIECRGCDRVHPLIVRET